MDSREWTAQHGQLGPGQLRPGQLGPGQLSPGQLGPGQPGSDVARTGWWSAQQQDEDMSGYTRGSTASEDIPRIRGSKGKD